MDKGILGAKTIKQASRLMKANVFTCPELIEQTYDNIVGRSHLNAFVTVRGREEALREAEESQKRIEMSKCLRKASSNKMVNFFTFYSLARWMHG